MDAFPRGTAGSLGILRFCVFLLAFFYVARTPLSDLALLPRDLQGSILLLQRLPEFIQAPLLTPFALEILRWVLLSLLALCALGIRPWRPFALPTLALLLVFDALVKGFAGYINHYQVGLISMVAVLALFPSADSAALIRWCRKRPASGEVHVAAHITMALILILPYLLIGIRRLVYGGLQIHLNDTIVFDVAEQSLTPARWSFRLGLLVLDHSWIHPVLKGGFLLITLLEILSPLVLICRPFRHFWLLSMLAFHLSTLLLMNIFFWENA
ncbi:MAG: hypothetical protein VKI81_12290, partial [Synechococcaceae cyanobacterium]|nr:hypothetical protein [Synechococcaceae cyanobacterium]